MKENRPLTRSYLETLSSQELINLADEYGIDIPDDLNRHFIIGDLLEIGEELEQNADTRETLVMSEKDSGQINVDTLPLSYNETKINVILRNPVSLFVWWDLGEYLLRNLKTSKSSLRLAVYFFETEDDEKPSDTFSIQVPLSEREQYVIIPAGKKFVRVDLCSENTEKTEVLSVSEKVSLPHGGEVMASRPGEDLNVSRIVKLSGVQDLLRKHYNLYRQSFY